MDEATRHWQAVDASNSADHGNIKSRDICHPNGQRVYLSSVYSSTRDRNRLILEGTESLRQVFFTKSHFSILMWHAHDAFQ